LSNQKVRLALMVVHSGCHPGRVERELSSVGFHEPSFGDFLLELSEDCKIQRRARRRSAGAGPVGLGGHGFDHRLGGRRPAGFGEDFDCGIELAELPSGL